MVTKINERNWNTAFYHSGELMAFVSIGATPDLNGAEATVQYYVTLSSKEYEDVYQSTHADLDHALASLSQKYGDWEIKKLDKEDATESGCSTCAAH